MTDEDPPTCRGRSVTGTGIAHDCAAAPKYELTQPAGPGKTRTLRACGRHLSWVFDYVSVPNRPVTVTRLR